MRSQCKLEWSGGESKTHEEVKGLVLLGLGGGDAVAALNGVEVCELREAALDLLGVVRVSLGGVGAGHLHSCEQQKEKISFGALREGRTAQSNLPWKVV